MSNKSVTRVYKTGRTTTTSVTSYDKKTNTYNTTTTSKTSTSSIVFILGALVVVILLAFILRYGQYADKIATGEISPGSILPTFSEFLDILSNSPTISPNFNIIPTILGDWGVFNWFRDFVNGLTTIIDFVLWLVQNLFLVLEYMFYFLKWVFIS